MIPPFITELVIDKAIEIAVDITPKIIKHLKGDGKGKIVAYRQVEVHKRAIIFIHGFTGSPTETFKNIPELILKEEKLNGFDIISIGYSSSIIPDLTAGFWSADPDIDNLSEYFKTIIEHQLSKYDTFAIVTHSMGGLVAQHGLLKLSDTHFKKVKNLIMFGTPSGGLDIANSKFLGMFKKQSLNMGSNSKFITDLRKDWKLKFKNSYPFNFKAVAGLSDEFVKRKSSLEVFDEKYRFQIEGNHSNMVKADNDEDTNNQCFSILLDDLIPQNTLVFQASSLGLNTLMAVYHTVVNELEANFEELDAKGLKRLSLALEGLGKDDKAIEVLENHRLSKENTDTMGILAGRYKRKYLFSGNKSEDAGTAMQHYTKGLEISLIKSDAEQIRYHAINLAFMFIVYRNDHDKMKEHAAQALKNCNVNTINIWELATIAEANLYLGNMDKAEKYYSLVKEKTNKQIRMRSSIHINAKFAFLALQGMEEDEF
jgi:pimeloyl-ACP methyl ester carboxylesterase